MIDQGLGGVRKGTSWYPETPAPSARVGTAAQGPLCGRTAAGLPSCRSWAASAAALGPVRASAHLP